MWSPGSRLRDRPPARAARRLELLVVQKLRVDRQDAALSLLLQLHHAVDGGEDAVTEQLPAAIAERIAVDTDQLHQPILEWICRQRKFRAQRHYRRDSPVPDVHADRRPQLLR